MKQTKGRYSKTHFFKIKFLKFLKRRNEMKANKREKNYSNEKKHT